ncbi:MAG: serine/threonine protein kinase [Sulfitobacter sp.]|nr:serine/threonine protein kinase [Sulfitobacter sp.]
MSARIEFIPVTLLKRDVFSETQSGHLADDADTRLTRRQLDRLPLWSRGIARYLARREARALRRLQEVDGVPRLIRSDPEGLIRSWLEGVPLQLAGRLHRTWADDAHRLLRQMHRLGVTHNDLAKPQNWLVTPDGRAAVIDLQLASVHRRRGLIFRLARYEDLRHLLKQKQRFAPELLTPTARRLLERRSWPSHLSHRTLKPVYNFVTRKVFRWSDSEGIGADMADRMASARDRILSLPGVTEVALAPFQRPGGLGLYAFVETAQASAPGAGAEADLVQTVSALPRFSDGQVRADLLVLVAENRVEEIGVFLEGEPTLAEIMRPIVEGRLNLTDRYIH